MTVTPVSSMAYMLVASFMGSFGAVFLKSGAQRLELNLTSLLSNYRLALGVITFLGSSYFFVAGMRHGELTVLYPMVSLGYVFTLFWSRLFFNEPFTKLKIIGLCMILVGIVCVTSGGR